MKLVKSVIVSRVIMVKLISALLLASKHIFWMAEDQEKKIL